VQTLHRERALSQGTNAFRTSAATASPPPGSALKISLNLFAFKRKSPEEPDSASAAKF
jgi:hypothetical protein